MKKVQLSLVSLNYERIAPLLDGTVQVEGAELVWSKSHPSETFWRQLKFGEFDISEMSMSSLLIAKSRGSDMVAIPVFPSRRFMHASLFIHVDSAIEKPEDLAGKRIGVGEYQQTAALWTRGTLEHDFEVSQYGVDWYMERSEELSHGGSTGFTPPEGIKFHRIPENKTLLSMLIGNELEAATLLSTFHAEKNVIDRSTQHREAGDESKVKPLFPDMLTEGKRFMDTHGFVPVNHCYVIRGDVHEQHPWLAFNLFAAFTKAKEHWYGKLANSIPSDLFFGPQYLAQTRSIVGEDPFPYGIRDNQKMLQTLIDYSFEQKLTPRKLGLEEIFARSTLDL
jgi:4,5-dihydroxyphthalate decarboxylase